MHACQPGATMPLWAGHRACEDGAMPCPATSAPAIGCLPWAPRAPSPGKACRWLIRPTAWLCAGLLASALAQAATPTAQPDVAVPPDLALQLLQLINRHRSSQALPTWEPDADLALIATAHSQRMAERHRIGHEGFDARFAQARRRLCVENLAAGFNRPEPVLAAWLASPSHRDNLLAPRPRWAGLGQVAGYITLMACD